MPVPEIVNPEVVATTAAHPPAEQMRDAVIASLLEAKPAIAPLAQPGVIAPALPAPQALEPALTPDPLASAEVIASLEQAKPVIAPLAMPGMIAPALPVPEALEPAAIPAEVIEATPAQAPAPQPQASETAPVAALEPQIIAPAPQIIEATPLPVPAPAPQAVEPAQLAALEPRVSLAPEAFVAPPVPAPLPAPEVAQPDAAPAQIVEPPLVIDATTTASAPQSVEAAPQPETLPMVVASVLPPPATNPVIISMPAPTPPEAKLASLPAPAQAPAPVIASQTPPAKSLASDLTWKAYVPAGTLVRVSNGTGRGRMASRFASYFGEHGMSVRRIANAKSFNYRRTTIFYNPDQREVAYGLAEALPFDVRLVEVSKGRGEVEIILGFDLLGLDNTLRKA